MHQEFLDLLLALDHVPQDPRWHPEGDALYHSLQVFDLARRDTDDRVLWAAALLHDVGKAFATRDHAEEGADLLSDLCCPRGVWLVRHHLHLLRAPGVTKRRLRNTRALADLGRLRRWDVGGRSPAATVLSPEAAVALLLDGADLDLLGPSGDPAPCDDLRKEPLT
ncbi:HD domain-containing protein [Chondromyces apiculatus]|uniref:tRNA nucleotidyltransferase n=1 Tax=Chondromyces apiculatus DSM 436 TaxID=1192034 RepID=A0A017TBG4_9BACT|nr:HD domain-containing protein [Chondromyces apiculatus]EYF05961.1 tRNA nucleotidyltransferase [Chondromyces apiculatus DSM 436]